MGVLLANTENIEKCRTDSHGPPRTTLSYSWRSHPSVQNARESTRRLHIVDNDGDDSDYSLAEEEESEDEKVNVGTIRINRFFHGHLANGS